jgi:hypothetical protein
VRTIKIVGFASSLKHLLETHAHNALEATIDTIDSHASLRHAPNMEYPTEISLYVELGQVGQDYADSILLD